MRQIELRLSEPDRAAVESVRRSGFHLAREFNRAHILACLDRALPVNRIVEVLGVSRVIVWRTGTLYLQHGLAVALFDAAHVRLPDQADCSGPVGPDETATARTLQSARSQDLEERSAIPAVQGGEPYDRSRARTLTRAQQYQRYMARAPKPPVSEALLTAREPSAALRQLLTARELQVLERMIIGQSNVRIARDLYLNYKTVSTHKASILAKLGLHTLPDLVRYADQHFTEPVPERL